MKVIIDFDNTFYTENRDVDDGLALLYLLGSPGVEVKMITSTFGNSDIETVHHDTLRLMEDLNITDIPYAKGGVHAGDYLNEASREMAQIVRQNPHEISILATGSMTNIFGAGLIEPEFFNLVKEIVIMGGTTEPLIFDKQEMLELNLSVDPQASYGVLTGGHNLSLMTGNNCLSLLFTREQYEKQFASQSGPIVDLIQKYSDSWFDDNFEEYGIPGYYNWDTLAAAYLINPEYFDENVEKSTISLISLSQGSLRGEHYDSSSYAKTRPVKEVHLNLPIIKDGDSLTQNIYQTWLRAGNQVEEI